MELLQLLLDFALHLDRHLLTLTLQYGPWIYAILFVIVFSETGFVVTPFLPGDSLLFVAGALAATGSLELPALIVVLLTAAVLGNQLNFAIGRWLGARLLASPRAARLLNPAYIARTHAFFEQHGGKTIVLSRFVPIVRTYAPFVAGIGEMPLLRFSLYNLLGALLWVLSLVAAGYFFGNLPFVRDHLTAVVLGIVFISVSPALVQALRQLVSRNTSERTRDKH